MLLRLDITAENNDFANVTLACEDSHEAEAHKVILDGSSHQTTIHTLWSKLEDSIFHPKDYPTCAERRWGEDTKNVNFIKMRNRGQNLVYREEKIICFENLENREEKENFNINISKNERRKRNGFSTS